MRKRLKIRPIRIPNNLFFLLLLVGLASGCYENIEGCLDLDATNFDVSADKSCEDCCSYPSLKINILHRIKDTAKDTFFNFALNTKISLNGRDTFQVSSLRYYLSDVQLIKEDGTLVGVEDTLTVKQFNSNGDSTFVTIANNFALVNRQSPTNLSIGTLRARGKYIGLQFNVGIYETANKAEPSSFPSTHPLAFGDSTMYFSRDSGYVFYRIQLFQDTLSTNPLLLENGTNTQLRQIIVNYPFELKIGFNTIVTLRVNYRKWFEQIAFDTDTKNDMVTKITQGLVESFEIAGVNYSLR